MIFDNDKVVGNISALLIAVIYCGLVIAGKIPADGFGLLAGIVIRHLIGIDTTQKNEEKGEKKDEKIISGDGGTAVK